jgi:hypothetical protein
MYFINSDKIFDSTRAQIICMRREKDRNNTSQINLLLEAATRLEYYLAVLNSSAVVGMPSNDFESNAGTSIFDLLALKDFDWLVYQEDTPYSDEYFNFFERSEISLDYVRKQNTPFYSTFLSSIIGFSSNTASAAFSPELSSVEENDTPNMQNEGNDIKKSTPKNFK